MTLTAALAQLATVPPKAFTRERDALAARLREAGKAEDAVRVKARRAPTLPVWVANRLAIEHPDDVQALIAAADRVKAAQLGGGGNAGTLAAATTAHRAALDHLLDRGRAMLNETGFATHDKLLRVQNTLSAAAVDAAARKALQAGALERELTPPGFDVFGGEHPAAAHGRALAAPAGAEPHARSRGAIRTTAKAEEPARRPDDPPALREEHRQRERADAQREERRRQRERERAQRQAQRDQQARAQRTERIAQARASLEDALQAASSAQERAESAKQMLKALLDQVPMARKALRETEAEMRDTAQAATRARRAVRAAEAKATR